MNPKTVTVPELFMIGGTRAALGAGIALLLADRLSHEQRRAIGWTLLAVGAISTIPLAAEVMLAHEPAGPSRGDGGVSRPERELASAYS